MRECSEARWGVIMNFLNFLNPWSPHEPGIRQRKAALLFPSEVAKSRLKYWRPGDAIRVSAIRYLIGVAASYSLGDLRFLDVLNNALKVGPRQIAVDVFNIADVIDESKWSNYFPQHGPYACTPVVGKWHNGVFQGLTCGAPAIDEILTVVGSHLTASQILHGLSPPAPELMEEYD